MAVVKGADELEKDGSDEALREGGTDVGQEQGLPSARTTPTHQGPASLRNSLLGIESVHLLVEVAFRTVLHDDVPSPTDSWDGFDKGNDVWMLELAQETDLGLKGLAGKAAIVDKLERFGRKPLRRGQRGVRRKDG